MRMEQIYLIPGIRYDWKKLHCIGWKRIDKSFHEIYDVSDYFSDSGEYLGPNQFGNEPFFEDFSDDLIIDNPQI